VGRVLRRKGALQRLSTVANSQRRTVVLVSLLGGLAAKKLLEL